MFKQRGLSLVELMIAVALGLILLTGVMQVFLSSRNVFSSQQALSRIQETGRMAIEFLSRDIRMAGFLGCGSRSGTMAVNNMLNQSGTLSYNFREAVRGYAPPGLPVPVGQISQTIRPGTDVIALRFASNGGGRGVFVTRNNNGAQLFVSDNGDNTRQCSGGGTSVSGLCARDILVVTDCEKANVFQAANVRTGSGAADDKVNVVHSGANMVPGNAIASWGGSSDKTNTFSAGSQVLFATSTVYFIANNLSGQPSLWQSINGTSVELLEGVEDMHIAYGIDTDADPDFIPNEYRLAANVANWNQVVSVRVELLIASTEDNVKADRQVYKFPTDAASSTTAADSKLRQVFSTTVAIRNRIR